MMRFAGFALFLCLAAQTGVAAPVAEAPEAFPRGEAISQRFLPSGASVVTTAAGSTCVVSQKIEIAQSSYVQTDGTAVPFGTIRRSVAASVQAIGGAPEAKGGAPAEFRIQMKYSLASGRPVWLDPGDGAGRVDIAAMREPSTDSLHLTGEVAARLAAAMAAAQDTAGQGVQLQAWSAETGRDVTDSLPMLDMAALADCRTTLAAADADPGPQANYLTVAFDAAPTPDTRATLDEMNACAMRPTARPVHLGRLTGTTGFFAQTNKVFVAFDAAGKPEQVYVPGVVDAVFTTSGVGDARVSIAADSNLPAAANLVKGCLGAAVAQMCRYPADDGSGGWMLHPCGMMPGGGLAGPTSFGPGGSPGGSGPGPAGISTLVPPSGGGGGGGGLPPPASIITDVKDSSGNPDPDPDPEFEPEPPLPPVPLPAAGWLMLAALAGLAFLRRGRA